MKNKQRIYCAECSSLVLMSNFNRHLQTKKCRARRSMLDQCLLKYVLLDEISKHVPLID